MADIAKTIGAMILTGIIAAAIVLGGTMLVVEANPDLPNQIREEHNQFEAFCTDLYGEDAHVYSGGSIGDHAGLHCSDGPMNDAIHRGQIPEDIWEQYKAGEVSAEYVANHLEPTQDFFNTFLPILLLVLAATVIATFIDRRYSDKDEVA